MSHFQKQKRYYHARFYFAFAPDEGGGIKGAQEKLLQRCNHEYRIDFDSPAPPISPLRMFGTLQLFEYLQAVTLNPSGCQFLETNEQNKHPTYLMTFENSRIVATLQRFLPSNTDSMTFHYHSMQYDEYYAFASAYAATVRTCAFWSRQDAMAEMFHRLRERRWEAIDYTTALIPE